MSSREQEMWSAGLFLGTFALLFLYWKILSLIAKGMFLFLRWAWRKNPGLCNCIATGVVFGIGSYYLMWRFGFEAQWPKGAPWIALTIGTLAIGGALYLWRRMRKLKVPVNRIQPQMEYLAVETNGQRAVQISNLRGSASSAIKQELRGQGLDRLVREARKVPWADQVILASATPIQPVQGVAVRENRLFQRPRVKSKLQFAGCEQKPNRSLPPRF